MAGSIIRRHFNTSKYEPIGKFASASAYLADINKTSAIEGMVYYDTTLDQLRTYNGSTWSPAGQTGISAGSLNDAASVGAKVTIDGSTVASTFEIECSDNGLTSGALLLLDNDDITNDPVCLDIDNDADSTSAVSIDIDGTAGYDIQGTSDSWNVTYAGIGTFAGLFLADDVTLGFGNNVASPDMTLGWDQTQFEFIPSTSNYQVIFGDGDPIIDVKIWGADTNAYVLFDGSSNEAIYEGYDIGLQDDDILNFGDADDIEMYWDQTQMQIVPASSGSDLFLGSSTYLLDVFHYGDVAFDGVTAGYDIQWDRSENTLDILDNVYVAFGASDDITLQWNDTDFMIYAAAPDTRMKIGGTSNGFDIFYYFEGSGTITTDYDALTTYYDGCDLKLQDNDYLLFGDSATAGGTVDNTIRYDSTGDVLEIIGGVLFEDDVQIGESGATNTLTVYGDVTLSGSLSYGTAGAGGSGMAVSLADNEKFYFGTGSDLAMYWDASNFLIEAGTQDAGTIRIGSTNSLDFIWYDNDATDTFTLDAGASTCTLLNLGLTFSDATSTFTVSKPASNALNINAGTANETIIIGASTNTDVSFQGGTASTDVLWDASDNSLEFADGAIIAFGSSDDVEISWNGSASTLNIEGAAANKSIVIGGTNTCDLTLNGGTADRDVVWDASDNSLEFADNAIIAFGSSDDIEILWDGSSSTLDVLGGAANREIRFGDPTNVDIVICGDITTDAVTFDTDAEDVQLNGFDLTLLDDDILNFGDADDVSISWVGSSSVLSIEMIAANKAIEFGKSTNFDVIIYGDASTDAVTFDTDAEDVQLNGFDLTILDDDILNFGDADDVSISWVGSSSVLSIEMIAADKAIEFGKSTNFDIIIYGDASTDAVTFDTSSETCTFNGFDFHLDNADVLEFGDTDAGDITMTYDGTQFNIDGAAANKNIRLGYTNNQDLTIYGEATGAYVSFDTDSTAYVCTFEGFDLTLKDDDVLQFGDTPDATITWVGSSSVLQVDAAAANRNVQFGYANNMDVTIYGESTATYVGFDTDASALLCTFEDFDLKLNDDDILKFGDDSDFTFTFDSTNSLLTVEGGTANTAISIGKSTNIDVVIYGDTSTDAVTFDTDAEDVQLNGFDLTILDDDILNFGDSDDFTITMDSTATALLIDGAAADKTISIGKTNNLDLVIYGDTSSDAVTFDTSAESCTFNGFDLVMNDNDIINFGDDGADGTIASDGTNIDFTITAALTLGDGGSTDYTAFNSSGGFIQYGTAYAGFQRRIIACGTSEAYTVTSDQTGTCFCTTGATDAVTFTLPTVEAGLNYKFCNTVDQSMTVASNEGDNMVILNDASADSVAFSTGSEKIGGSLEVICDGTKWLVFITNWSDDAVNQTFTTAT